MGEGARAAVNNLYVTTPSAARRERGRSTAAATRVTRSRESQRREESYAALPHPRSAAKTVCRPSRHRSAAKNLRSLAIA